MRLAAQTFRLSSYTKATIIAVFTCMLFSVYPNPNGRFVLSVSFSVLFFLSIQIYSLLAVKHTFVLQSNLTREIKASIQERTADRLPPANFHRCRAIISLPPTHLLCLFL